jgi:hypothetical protein
MIRHFITMSPDLHSTFEFLEGDTECAVMRYAVQGHATEADGGGELEVAVTEVAVVRGGLVCYCEIYPPDTAIELLRARGEQLRPLARRRPGAKLPIEPLPVEDAMLRLTKAIDAGDWTALTTMLDPRLVVLDHRGGAPGNRDMFVARVRAASAGASRYTVVAASDSLSAGVLTLGDESVGAVMDWQPGTCRRIELFDEADEAGMLAALARPRAASPAPRSEKP